MKKKIIAIVLSVIMVLSITGCGSKDPVKRLEKAFDNSMKMDFATQSFDMDVSVDFSEESPEFDMFKNMINGANISGIMDVNQKDMTFAGKMKLDLNGMAFEMELYRGEEYFIKMPFTPKYIVIADKDESEELFNEKSMKELSKDMNKLIFSKLSTENTKLKDEITIEQSGEKIKVTPISITLTEEEAKLIFSEMMEVMLNSPEFMDQMKNTMKKEMKDTDENLTNEEIDEIYKESLEEMDKMLKGFKEGVSLKKMDFVYYLDNKDNVRKNDIDYIMIMDIAKILQASIPEDTDEELPEGIEFPAITFGIKGTSDIYNINKIQELIIPELTAENSSGIEGLIGDL